MRRSSMLIIYDAFSLPRALAPYSSFFCFHAYAVRSRRSIASNVSTSFNGFDVLVACWVL